MILGLDVSTSITGATVLDKDGKVTRCEIWDFRNKKKYPTFLSKAEGAKKYLAEIWDKHEIEAIYIEQSLSRFRPGFSSAKTILTLAKFNGIVSWLCKDVFRIEPEFLGATAARKTCGIEIKRGENAKEKVLHFLLDKEDSFVVDYTKHGNPKPGSYDRADSLVIARAGYRQWQINSTS
tara:strand:+ start:249 stop:785 length:537 start_codon:yes stop_codon:yes gene_type:complete